MAVRRVHSQSPDDDFVPNKKRPRQTASKLKRRFAAISSEEVEAVKKPIVVKNTEVYFVGCSRVHVMGRGAK